MKVFNPFKSYKLATTIIQNLRKKGHKSVKILRMTFKFELDMYFMMLYPSVNIE